MAFERRIHEEESADSWRDTEGFYVVHGVVCGICYFVLFGGIEHEKVTFSNLIVYRLWR